MNKNKNEKKVIKTPKEEVSFEPHKINLVLTNGEKYQIMSCYGKENDTLALDIDPFNHPAWKDDSNSFVNNKDEQISKFKKKFGDLKF